MMASVRRLGLCGVMFMIVGCATTSPTVDAPPLAEDLGWSAPVAVKPPAPDVPSAPTEPETARSSREKVYPFIPGECYRVDVPVGTVVALAFKPGEEIRDWADGDRSPVESEDHQKPLWEFKQSYAGAGVTGRPAMLITVPKAGLKNGLTVTTTGWTYCVDLQSVSKSAIRSVRWTYPDDAPKVAKAPPRLWPDPTQPQRYHAGYEITASEPTPVWTPRQAVDDGSKTYIVFPPTVTSVDAPLIRLVGSSGPELVNARQAGNVVILDRLFNRAELRLGASKQAEVVTIQRLMPVTIACPGDARCPVWPDAVVRAVP